MIPFKGFAFRFPFPWRASIPAEVKCLLIEACKSRRVLTFDYNEKKRFVEPYTYGTWGYMRNEMLCSYQFEGGSVSGGIPDWRVFDVSKIKDLAVTDKLFEIRQGYNPCDKRFKEVFAQV